MTSKRRLRSRRGYTVAEVGISMTLFGIGAASVIAMERTSVQGDADARQQDVATSVAAQWVARLQQDALNWKLLAPYGDTRANTLYLRDAYGGQQCGGGDSGVSYSSVWYTPGTLPLAQTWAAPADGKSFAFDVFGHDLPVTSSSTPPDAAYCAQISECFEDNPVAPVTHRLIQAPVRVIWPRKINSPAASDWCSSSTSSSSLAAFASDAGADTYRSVSVTVMLQGGYGQ